MTGSEPSGPLARPLKRVGLPILLSLAAVSALKGLSGQAAPRAAGGFWGALKPQEAHSVESSAQFRYAHCAAYYAVDNPQNDG
jgi:hypothetical protein